MGTEAGVLELVFRAKLDQLDRDMATARTKGVAAAEQMGTEMANGVGSKFAGLGDKIGSALSPAKLAAGVGAFSSLIGGGLAEVGDKLEKSEKQLQAAGEAAGIPLEQLDEITKKAVSSMENFGHTSTDTNAALQKFVQAGRPAEEMTKDMALAADLAASKHISLSSAASLIDKVYAGNAKALKEYGIVLKANATDEEKEAALAELGAKVHGQAAAAVDTFGGHLEIVKTKMEDFIAKGAAKIGPALMTAGPMLAGVGGIIQSGLIPGLISGVGAAASFGAGMIGAGVSAVGAAVPVIVAWAPVILTIAAIGLAGYELYQHWDQVWGFIKAIAGDAADWVKDHLTLIASVVLLPLAPLILLVTHWRQAFDFVENITGDAIDWVRSTVSGGIDDVVGFVSGFPGRAVSALGDLGGVLWGAGEDLMRGLRDGIEAGAGAVWDSLKSFASKALHAVTHPWEVFSPSRVTHRLGLNIMAGMAGGLDTGSSGVLSTAGKVTGRLMGALGISSRSSLSSLAAGSRPDAVVPLDQVGSMAGAQVGAGGSGPTYIVQGSLVTERELRKLGRDGTADVARYNGTTGF